MNAKALRGWSAACALLGAGWAGASEPAPPRAAPVTVAPFIVPMGTLQAALSPDASHVALLEDTPQGRRVRIVTLADRSARVVLRPRWVDDGYHRELRNPWRVMWVGSRALAVDHGLAAEAIDLQGQPLVELGSGVIGLARDAGPNATEVLVWNDDEARSIAVVDVATRRKRVLPVPPRGELQAKAFDNRGNLRAALMLDDSRWRDSSRWTLWYRPRDGGAWVPVQEGGLLDEPWVPLRADAERDELLVVSRRGRDKRALLRVSPLQPGQPPEPVFEDPEADVTAGTLPEGTVPVSVLTVGLKPRVHWLDADWRDAQRAVDEALPGRVNQLSGDVGAQVLVHSRSDTEPGQWYLFDTQRSHLQLLARARVALERDRARPMQALHYPARDGTRIPAYLTLPEGPRRPGPAVVLVHGGPHQRDSWGWDDEVQLLAQRGYAVIQPQFRGSTGFGLAFERAGYGQWGRLMQDDISDAVAHLVREQLADPQRVCIVGASFGGYAALWGLISTPELYRCGVSFAGVTDLAHLFDDGSDTLDRRASVEWLRHSLGSSRRDRAALDAVSPVQHAARLRAPLLLAHGDEDRRVPMSHARRLMSALDAAGRRYEWLKLRDAGHGLHGFESRREYYERLLQFLDRHIGPGAGAASGAAAR